MTLTSLKVPLKGHGNFIEIGFRGLLKRFGITTTMLSARGNAYLFERENEWCYSVISIYFNLTMVSKNIYVTGFNPDRPPYKDY